MGKLFRIPDQHRRYPRIDIKYQLQLIPAALHCRHRDHVIEHGNDHVLFPRRNQRALYDLRIIQHIIDLIGQALSRQLYGLHICPKLGRKILLHSHLADPQHHIDRCSQLMGYIRQKHRVLPSRGLQLRKCGIIPLFVRPPPVMPVPGDLHRPCRHCDPQPQTYDVPGLHAGIDGMQIQKMIQQYQHIQSSDHVQQPLFIQHGKHQDHNAGHGR